MNYINPSFYNNYQTPPYVNNQNLNGKIVDNIDSAKVADVGIGSYGIFPKADFSEIYIKYWNQNGTTNLVVFKPMELEKTTDNNEILNQIQAIGNKLDTLINAQPKKETINEY